MNTERDVESEYTSQVFAEEARLWLVAVTGAAPQERQAAAVELVANLASQRDFMPDDPWWQRLITEQIAMAQRRTGRVAA